MMENNFTEHGRIPSCSVAEYEKIVAPLLFWYQTNKRILPWRDKNNAYYTWISEIMLQQTRVEAVKPYFERFIKALPDIQALAECPQDRLLKLWEGLGYYSRARNMQLAAEIVMEEYEGMLPASYAELQNLPGIGSYTAGAVASIAYGICVPAVDGNVLRVVSRLTADGSNIMKQSVRNRIGKELEKLLPEKCPGDFNQAMMELGAVICIPNGTPKCGECPLAFCCRAFLENRIEEFPVKAEKKARTMEERTVLVIQDGNVTALKKRPDKGLLAGLYELPNVKGHLTADEVILLLEEKGLDPMRIETLKPAKHIFSHIEWRMIGYRIRVSSLEGRTNPELIFVSGHEAQNQYPIPSAFRAYEKYIKTDMYEKYIKTVV